MTRTITAAELVELLLAMPRGRRTLIAIAGPPGVGKSIFADLVRERLEQASPGRSDILPMDGYHFDDRVLEERGHRSRKGAPFTFDTGGLRAMLRRLKADDGTEIAAPVFDRRIEIARAGAKIIAGSTRIILVEGNYLLLDDPEWQELSALFDLTVMLDAPESVLLERLTRRWRDLGFEEEAARAKVEGNDAPNLRLVLRGSRAADYRIETAENE